MLVMQLNLSHVSCAPQQAKGILFLGTDNINYIVEKEREFARVVRQAIIQASDQEAIKGPDLNILKHMNRFPNC